jgi:hypothetical protein
MAELREQPQTTLGDSYQLEQELGGSGMSRDARFQRLIQGS